jgi:hypothetical protein
MDISELAILIAHKKTNLFYPEDTISSKVLGVIQDQCQKGLYFNTKTFIVEMPSVFEELSKLKNTTEDQNISVDELYSQKADLYLNEICDNFGEILDVQELHESVLSGRHLKTPFTIKCTKVHSHFSNYKEQLKKLVSELKKSQTNNPLEKAL